MPLYILKPHLIALERWVPWFDKVFGFVIRAKNEIEARKIAQENAGEEDPSAWLLG